jgi:CheY-like chemotaxis protein
MLADDFNVVGACTGGREALDLALQVAPDVIVLDVDMPELDGFQTLQALRRSGSPTTPVVFLSMHFADEMIAEAFRCGGRGYVLKARVARDLPSAIDQALLGRSFVPSLTSLFQLGTGVGHAMQVHSGVESFLDGLSAFFDLALRRGDAACVIGTPQVREGLGARLRARGWDVGGPSGHERYLVFDAVDALNRFMRDGLPDRDPLGRLAVELDEFRSSVAGATSRLSVFGDMVMALSADGNADAMIALEHHWNALTHDLPFLTLCGYSTSCFHDGVPELWSNVCTAHWALSHASDV